LHRCSLTFILRETLDPSGIGKLPAVWISSLLGQLDSANLEEIMLEIKAYSLEDIEAMKSETTVRNIPVVNFDALATLDWENLEQSVFTGHLASLKRIVVIGKGDCRPFLSFMHSKHCILRPFISAQLSKYQD
jgi:hypothetical protein